MSEVTVASTSELPEVAAFYATCGYGGGISQADTVLVSRIRGQLVGVVRLCPQEGVVVLRGMQVHPAFRRQGVGSRLLSACIPFLAARLSSYLERGQQVLAMCRVAPNHTIERDGPQAARPSL